MLRRLLALTVSSALTLGAAKASEPARSASGELQAKTNTAMLDSIADEGHGVIFPKKGFSLALSHFTWGVDLGASIDLTAHNMSTLNADVHFGYKNDYIRLVGVGAGIHRSFGAGNNFIPVYVIFRSSFRKKPSLFFLNLKAGYSFNTISDSPTYGDISGSVGLGINLAISKTFKSHIIIGYSFRHFNRKHQQATNLDIQNISLATVCFGVDF